MPWRTRTRTRVDDESDDNDDPYKYDFRFNSFLALLGSTAHSHAITLNTRPFNAIVAISLLVILDCFPDLFLLYSTSSFCFTSAINHRCLLACAFLLWNNNKYLSYFWGSVRLIFITLAVFLLHPPKSNTSRFMYADIPGKIKDTSESILYIPLLSWHPFVSAFPLPCIPAHSGYSV